LKEKPMSTLPKARAAPVRVNIPTIIPEPARAVAMIAALTED
jgi:hypothetical protein